MAYMIGMIYMIYAVFMIYMIEIVICSGWEHVNLSNERIRVRHETTLSNNSTIQLCTTVPLFLFPFPQQVLEIDWRQPLLCTQGLCLTTAFKDYIQRLYPATMSDEYIRYTTSDNSSQQLYQTTAYLTTLSNHYIQRPYPTAIPNGVISDIMQ